MYLAEAAGRCLSPTGALSPDRPRSPVFAAGQGAGGGSGFHSSQVMGLEGLMYGSPTYVRPPRCAPSHLKPAVPAVCEVAGRKVWGTGSIRPSTWPGGHAALLRNWPPALSARPDRGLPLHTTGVFYLPGVCEMNPASDALHTMHANNTPGAPGRRGVQKGKLI